MHNYSIKESTYEGRVGPRVGSGRTFCRQSRVGSGQRFAGFGSGPRKVTREQLWNRSSALAVSLRLGLGLWVEQSRLYS